MHPAASIISFTTLSGAGYGLLFVAILAAMLGLLPGESMFAFVVMALGVAMVSIGLLSSLLHLGHPERARQALTQWRTSWLSREGVASILTFLPLAVFGIGWVFLERTQGLWAGAGLLALIGAIVTVGCTGMIYASLKPIRAWNTPWSVAVYYLLALASGSLLLAALNRIFGVPAVWADVLAIVTLGAAWICKLLYWRDIDSAGARRVPAKVIGIENLKSVRQVLPPHTEENYLLKEMGFRVARKHASKLRTLAVVFGLGVPLVLLLGGLAIGGGVALAFVLLAVVSAGVGIALERWLFFAEAKHTVSYYYESFSQ